MRTAEVQELSDRMADEMTIGAVVWNQPAAGTGRDVFEEAEEPPKDDPVNGAEGVL